MDLIDLEDDERHTLLGLAQDSREMTQVALFCNAYPDVDLEFEVEDSEDIHAGDAVTVVVKLQREDGDEDDEEGEGGSSGAKQSGPVAVNSPLYPGRKTEGWWLVVGDKTTNALYAIKKVALQTSFSAKLEFEAPDEVSRGKGSRVYGRVYCTVVWCTVG